MKINNSTEEFKEAYLYCIKLLTRRDYHPAKIIKKLVDRNTSEEVAHEVVEKLKDLGFINEESFKQARIKSLMLKNLSPSYIQLKLEQSSINTTIEEIKEVFSEYKITTRIQIEELTEKKIRAKGTQVLFDFNFRKKLLRYLVSKGHELDESNRVIESVSRRNDDHNSFF